MVIDPTVDRQADCGDTVAKATATGYASVGKCFKAFVLKQKKLPKKLKRAMKAYPKTQAQHGTNVRKTSCRA